MKAHTLFSALTLLALSLTFTTTPTPTWVASRRPMATLRSSTTWPPTTPANTARTPVAASTRQLPPNTGLWQKLQGPLFPRWAPPATSPTPPGIKTTIAPIPAPSDQALVITTNADGWGAGPQEYSYNVDSYDLGGVNPATTGGDVLKISFWSCSLIPGTPKAADWVPTRWPTRSRSTTAAATSVSPSAGFSRELARTSPRPTSGAGCNRPCRSAQLATIAGTSCSI